MSTVLEDSETLLASSRAKILSLWIDLSEKKITRGELNLKMTELLDDLEINHPETFKELQPELHALRQSVIKDDLLSQHED